MDEKQFEEFRIKCYDELINKQNTLIKEYDLGSFDEYWLDQTTETLQFKNEGKVELEFPIIEIGSWSANKNTWMWAWANNSVTDSLRKKAERLKELTKITNNLAFETEAFEAEEIIAHELTALAVHHFDAIGMYIAPFETLKVFLALFKPEA
jgi:hypothetical protein